MSNLKEDFRIIILSIIPFLILIPSFLLININQNLKEKSTSLNQYYFLVLMLIGLTFIPGFLQIRISFENKHFKISYNLTHHPPELIIAHEAFIRGKSICLGCFGGFIGLVLGEGLLLLYLIKFPFYDSFNISHFILGALLILFSYSRYYHRFSGKIRFTQHISFFIGLSFLLIASDKLFQSFYALIFLLPSWIGFLIVRAFLGQLDHKTQLEKVNAQ